MKEAAYNFIVSSKTYLNSQVISKRKSTKSQHIEQNERAVSGHGPTGPGHHRAAGRGCGPWSGPWAIFPCRPFSPVGPGRPTARQASHVLIYQFFLTKVNFFSQITTYERSSIQFHCFKQNISQFTSYIKEKKHKITTYRTK